MKIKLLLFFMATVTSAMAQKSSRLFSVTDLQKGGYNWSAIRTVSEGMAPQVVMNNLVAKGSVMDAGLQKKKTDYSPTGGNYTDQPMFSGVAALAYDQQHAPGIIDFSYIKPIKLYFYPAYKIIPVFIGHW